MRVHVGEVLICCEWFQDEAWLATFQCQFSASSIPWYIFLPIRSNELKKLTNVLLVNNLKTTVVINKICKGFQKNIIFQRKCVTFCVMDFNHLFKFQMNLKVQHFKIGLNNFVYQNTRMLREDRRTNGR